MIEIDSFYTVKGSFKADYPLHILKNEPMLFNCDRDAAYELGGPITKEYMENLPEEWKNCKIVVDSRVHMLKPGFLPCIGGWHHDDVPRNTPTGQPNYTNPEYRSCHIMGLVGGDICPTQFAVGKFSLELPPPDQIIYQVWHKQVQTMVEEGFLKTYFVESGKYIEFDDRSFHQGTFAKKDGWRWLIRISKDTDRVFKCTNELRRQTQVYLDVTQGW